MLSAKRLFVYWLISVVISVGLPLSVSERLRPIDPGADSLASMLFQRNITTSSMPAPAGTGIAPTQTGAGVAVSPKTPSPEPQRTTGTSITPATPPGTPTTQDPSAQPGTATPTSPPPTVGSVRQDDLLEEKDAGRPVSLRGHGAFLEIITDGHPVILSDGRSIVPVVAQRWDVRTTDKVIALTFDDGPHAQNTAQILDVLKKYDARATFFVVGDIAQGMPDLLKRMAADGHEIGNHGYSHRTGHSTTVSEYVDEMEKTREVIRQAPGATSSWYRPNNMHMTAAMLIAGQKTGHRALVWSIDTRDWAAGSVDTIVRAVDPEHIAPGSVVLFHDGGGGRERTVQAVDRVLAALKARGFTSVTVSELIQRAK